MKKVSLILLAALLLLTPGGIVAQETVPNQGRYFPQPGARKLDGDTWITGQLYRGTAQTDWIQWFPAVNYCRSDTATQQNGMIPTRIAQFDWAMSRTAAGAETLRIICSLNMDSRSTTNAGYKLTQVDIVYGAGVANITTHTFDGIRTVTYATDALNAVGTVSLSTSPTMATAFRATFYLTSAVISGPVFENTVDRSLIIEWTAVLTTNGTYQVYGVGLRYTRAD